RAKLFGLARPVRRPPSSSRATCTAFSIFSSASKSGSSITPASPSSARGAHQRADLLTSNDPGDVAVGQVEHDDRHAVVPAQAEWGRIGDLQPTQQDVVVADRVESDGVRMGPRVGVVHAVNTALAHQQNLTDRKS